MKIRFLLALCTGLAFPLSRSAAAEGDEPLQIEKASEARLISISISGFSPEVEGILRFDLEVLGFKAEVGMEDGLRRTLEAVDL